MPTATAQSSPFHVYTDPEDPDQLDSHANENEPSIDDTVFSRRQSGYTAISSIPPSLPPSDFEYLPHKTRPPFRSPSSVRAIQLSSPSPLASPRLRADNNGRKWVLPASIQVESKASSLCGSDTEVDSILEEKFMMRQIRAQRQKERDSYLQMEPGRGATPLPQHRTQAPLVLLHVSPLPSTMPPYSLEQLEAHAPKYVVDNYHLLREKMSDVVLARGILIPHPGEEYDLLEERLLEALELCTPRVLGCGHFRSDTPDDDGFNDEISTPTTTVLVPEVSVAAPESEPRAICEYAHINHSSESFDLDDDICSTCTHTVRLPHRGAGRGNRRWDVKFYASNGLMRSGAWSAAWREMERVDVEITTWMSEDVKRALELALEDEEKEREEKARHAHEAYEAREAILEKLQSERDAAARKAAEAEENLHKAQEEMTELVAEAVKAARKQPVPSVAEHSPLRSKRNQSVDNHVGFQHQRSRSRAPEDIPLTQLLQNYVYILAQDKRNIAVAALSFLVLLLSVSILSPGHPTDVSSQLPAGVQYAVPSLLSAPPSMAPVASVIPDSVIGDVSQKVQHHTDPDRLPLPGPAMSSTLSASLASLGSTASAADANDSTTRASPDLPIET
jgi:hypothetical protein